MSETNEGYQPSEKEIETAEEMMTEQQKDMSEYREGILRQVEELKTMGKEQFRRVSSELATKIAAIVLEVKDAALSRVAEGIQDGIFEPDESFAVRRSINRFLSGEFKSSESEESDPIRYSITQDGLTEFPISLLAQKATLYFGPHGDPEAAQGAPEWCPIHYVVWEKVREKFSKDEWHTLGLISTKQNLAQGVFENETRTEEPLDETKQEQPE